MEQTTKTSTSSLLATGKSPSYTSTLYARAGRVILTLAAWGWFPLSLAEWIVNQGGHGDD